MSDQVRARRNSVPAEAITSLILFVIVFVFLAGAVMSGHLPLPHV